MSETVAALPPLPALQTFILAHQFLFVVLIFHHFFSFVRAAIYCGSQS